MEKNSYSGSPERGKTYEAKTYDELVGVLEKSLEIKTDRLINLTEEQGEAFENNLFTWIRAVDFADDKIVKGVIKGKDTQRKIDFNELELPEEIGQDVPVESVLGALALTEAKLKIIRDLMDDVYPVLSNEADNFLKSLQQSRNGLLGISEESINLKEALSREERKRRRMGLLLSLTVIATMVIAACNPANGGRVDATPTDNEPKATETALPTETASPTVTASPVMPMVTKTALPTSTPTKEVTPTEKPREFLVGALPETIDECKQNYVRWDHLDEDMGKILESERKISVWSAEEIMLGRNLFEENMNLIYSETSSLYINYRFEGEVKPLVKTCAYTEIEGHGVYIFTVEVPLPSNPGVMINMHFGYDEEAAKVYYKNKMDVFESNLGFNATYPYMKGKPEDSFVLVQIYNGEPNNSSMANKKNWLGLEAIMESAVDDNYVDLYTRGFLTNNPEPLTDDEVCKLEEIVFPVRWFGAHPEP